MRNKRNKRQTTVRIIAIVMAGLMLLGVMGTLINYLFYYFG